MPAAAGRQPTTTPQTERLAAHGAAIGTVDLLSPAEEIELRECERIVGESLGHFARVGEALVRIRDKQLYKNEYHSFEGYCRERWDFGQAHTWRYLSAARVRQALGSVPGIPMPECEAQVRPLTTLPAELAQQAWLHALSCCRESYVPARLVQRAVKHVLKTEQPEIVAKSNADRQQRCRLRQSVHTGFQELLTLLVSGAERDVLIAKVQAIEGLLGRFLNPKKTKV